MFKLQTEFANLGEQITDERVRALKRIIPSSTVRTILKQARQTSYCSRLPKWFLVWLVIGMGLFCTDSYRQIFRWFNRFRPNGTPGRSTLCEGRQRLGVSPLRLLMDAVVKLCGTLATPDCFYCGLRLMALDGFLLDLPDTADNARIFGRPRNGKSEGAFPQARIAALCEVGTHILWKILIKPMRRAEITMARALLRHLQSNMLLLWDRGFLSYAHVAQVIAQGAQLLARVKTNLIFKPIRQLGDGSYLAKMYRSQGERRRDENGIVVRIIDYTFDDAARPHSGTPHRLLTTLLDEHAHPATRLIVLYHERWEEELAIDELKTHQRQRAVLRSQTPAGAVQEIYGMLLGHYVVRVLMCEAAARHEIAPRRMSFVGALKILRCRMPECPQSNAGLQRWYDALLDEIGEEQLPKRRDRVNPRVIKRAVSKWPKKRKQHRNIPQPTKDFGKSTRIPC